MGGVGSLLLSIAWMIHYEKPTGFSAGNAPLAWIFFYSPVGAATGQLIGLMMLLFKKPV
jgi:hypothetical protein